MRSLSPTLLAAQKEASTVPYVKVTVSDRLLDVVRLRWERLYTGGETDAYHAAAMPADGSLLRARVDPSGPRLYYQRTGSPGAQSDFSSWTDFGSVADADVALAASGSEVLLAYVASNGSDILVRASSDDGATFGSAVTAASLANVTRLACALKSNGDALLIYADQTTVYTAKRVSGSWGTPAAWPYTASGITGLAVTFFGDYDLAIAGRDTNNDLRLWTAIYGDGFSQPTDTWSALSEMAEADAGSNVSFKAPFLTLLDTYRLFFVEDYAGTVAYSRPRGTWLPPGESFAAGVWREPVPFDVTSSFGTAITGSSSYAWLSTPSGVWRAPLTAPETDLSADVLELSLETRRTRGRAKITLRNDDGRYNDLPNGPYSVIRPGAQLEVSPGYVTSAGQETSLPGLTYWVDGWEHTSAGGEATLVLYGSDAWATIERWSARRQHTWQSGDATVSQILRFVLGQAGVKLLNVGTSSTAVSHKPDFTIHPGEDGLRVVERLLAMIPDQLCISDVFAYLTEPKENDSSDYDYGTDHAILRARYASAGLAVNRVQVFGDGLVAQEFDWPDIEDQLDRLRQVFDLNMTSQAKAEERAILTLRQEELALPRGELVTPVNCGQELYDVISVTDEQAGLSLVTYRVAGVDLRYVRRGRTGGRSRSPVYEQRLLLGKV